MQQFWTGFLPTLMFLALATSDQLILEITDKDWSWIPIPRSGVSVVSVNANLYHNDKLQFNLTLYLLPSQVKKRFGRCSTSPKLLTVNISVRQTSI